MVCGRDDPLGNCGHIRWRARGVLASSTIDYGWFAKRRFFGIVFRTLASAAHERSDFRFCRECYFRCDLLQHAAVVQGENVVGRFKSIAFLGLASDHRRRGFDVTFRDNAEQGVCGTGVADRYSHCGRLAVVLRCELHDDLDPPPRASHVRGFVVLHCDDCHCDGLARV